MPRRGFRKRIARAIYQDGTGRSGIYRDGSGRAREVRFPPHTPISEIRRELQRRQAKTKGSGTLHRERGTLAAAVDRWDGLERHLASWMERRAELRAWVKLYGHKRVSALTPDDARTALGIWTRAGLAAKTIRNRLWTLKHLYRVLFGPEIETPVDHVEPPPKVRTVVQHVSPSVILDVYQRLLDQERKGLLRDAKTRARFMVRAATGRRPIEIMRTRPEDVDFARRVWRVRDAKGGWSEGLFLNDDMLAAWQAFAAAKAWGYFDTGGFARVLRNAGWPEGVRPYNLRHSIGIDLSEGGADLADVGGWLGHTSVQTTRSAYVPVLNSRMQRLSEQLEGRLGGFPALSSGEFATPVPRSVPRSHVEKHGSTWKHGIGAERANPRKTSGKGR